MDAKLNKRDYVYIAAFVLFLGFIWFLSYCDGTFESGPFKVTLYGCNGICRSWNVKWKPEINGFGGGFKFTDEDGNTIVVSGNVVIERDKQ